MARTSKRPYVLPMTDAHRVAVPTLEEQRRVNQARYSITPLGRVYRDDGRLLVPDGNLKINFHGGRVSRSLPKLVFLAFAHPELLARWHEPADPLHVYDPWVETFGERDEVTKRRRCTVRDVVLVPHAELITFGRYGRPPATRLSILELPQ